MNQNEMGKQYKQYLLRVYFSNKNFDVPELNEQEKKEMTKLQEQLNPNIKSVVEENAENKTNQFKELDNTLNTLSSVNNSLIGVKDIDVVDHTLQPFENKAQEQHEKLKEPFNQLNQEFKIADIRNRTDAENPEREVTIDGIEGGIIKLETEEAYYEVAIPHEDYMRLEQNPNNMEFIYNKDTEQVYYRDVAEIEPPQNNDLNYNYKIKNKQKNKEDENEMEF